MKGYKRMISILVLVSALTACASIPNFVDVNDRDWCLVEVRSGQQHIIIDRSKSEEEGFGDIFTIHFDEVQKQISGVGAPNRYFARYSLEGKQDMTISAIAATLMATLFEPENFKEHEFFAYLHNVNKWNLVGENLELYSKGEDGSETVLIFVLAE